MFWEFDKRNLNFLYHSTDFDFVVEFKYVLNQVVSEGIFDESSDVVDNDLC